MPFIEHQGNRVFFNVHGDGPPVVLGHSFLCSGEMWANQLDPLARRFRIINIDFRGHGQSGEVREPFTLYDLVDDFVAVLDHLNIERAVWAGLSIGGMVALRAALVARDRVSALILVDTHAGSELPYMKLKYRVLALGVKVVGTRPFLPAIAPMMFGPTTRKDNPTLVREWQARFATVHVPSTLYGLGALIRRDSIVHRLNEIDVPSLVIVGEEDTSLPLAYSSQIAEAVTDSSLVTISKSGHLSALEQPEAVTTAMLGFLDNLEPQAE
jgi:pimeloyl-ACP methyl ester carboxylesterase